MNPFLISTKLEHLHIIVDRETAECLVRIVYCVSQANIHCLFADVEVR